MTSRTYDTDPGPVPFPTPAERKHGDRLRAIAAIHAYADWLAAHPDVPTPDMMKSYTHNTTSLTVDQSQRLANALADAHPSTTKHNREDTNWVTLHRLGTREFTVDHTVFLTPGPKG